MAALPSAANTAKRRTIIVVECSLAAATATALLALFACAQPTPPPAKATTVKRAPLAARDWCQTFEYREGSAAWTSCLHRWSRNLARQGE